MGGESASPLVVSPAQAAALKKIADRYDRIGPISPEDVAAREAAMREVVGALPDGDYVLVVDPMLSPKL